MEMENSESMIDAILGNNIQNGILISNELKPCEQLNVCEAVDQALKKGLTRILVVDLSVYFGREVQENFYSDSR